MFKELRIFIAVVALAFLAGCNGCNKNKSREKPDVSNIHIDLHWLRFDKDLTDFANHDFSEWENNMMQKYDGFYNFYVSNFIIGPRPAGDTTNITAAAVQKFLDDKYIRTIQDSINARYKDTKDVEAAMKQMFLYFKYYFPEMEVPDIITINSAYGAGVSPFGRNQLIIGLDMFLGQDNRDYDSAGVYEYLRHKMSREYIPRYVAEAMYEEYYGKGDVRSDEALIEAMVDKGKKMYFLSYVFPDAPDSLILGYTQPQTEWCEKSEYSIWQFFNDKDLLYKENAMDKARYLGDGPTTSGMPPEAPGTIGNFIGLQIVRKFMKETGEQIPLHELIVKYDAKTIFKKSKYRPSKSNF